MSRLAVLVLVLLALAVPAAAQAPFPGGVQIGTEWVPCNHPKALAVGAGCGTPVGPWPVTTALPVFAAGRTYTAPYGYRMRVLSTTITATGDAAVTCEWLLGDGGMRPANGAGVGDVFAFLASSRFARKWWEVARVGDDSGT